MNSTGASSGDSEMRMSKWVAWAHLVRLPNVFTIVADISAAFLLISHGPHPVGRLVLVLLGGISLYWAGMTLNDVFDEHIDREQRAKRPIPAGWISSREAKRGGWILLFLGITFATLSGFFPSVDLSTTWLPALVSIALAIMIVAYDGPLKSTFLAPTAMGSCRFLSFLLGASPCIVSPPATPFTAFSDWIPPEILAIASGFGLFIIGVTTMARREAIGGSRQNLIIGALTTATGVLCLAFAPKMISDTDLLRLDTESVFPTLIGLISLPVLLRAVGAAWSPSPPKIMVTIKAGILTIIPFSAAFASLGAGPVWGLILFSLMFPALLLSAKFRVT